MRFVLHLSKQHAQRINEGQTKNAGQKKKKWWQQDSDLQATGVL